jgi:hypothetical protein
MHLYVDGEEKAVMVTEGKQNPTGTINRSAVLYIGHDSNTLIDEVSISNTATPNIETAMWMQGWFWATVAVGVLVAFTTGAIVYFKKHKQ